ncbi:hypothetical protein HK100_012944, partial [Physocladia obscura]
MSNTNTTEVEATFKLLMISDSGTGKSSLLLRFTENTWLKSEEVAATIGVKIIYVDDKRYKLTIWDTADQERFRPLTSSYYHGAQGVIMVYDVTQRDSFAHLETWFNELDTYTTNPLVVKILVGNKIDKRGEVFAKRMSTLFVESSAKSRSNVIDAFVEVVRKIAETPELYQKTAANVTRAGNT